MLLVLVNKSCCRKRFDYMVKVKIEAKIEKSWRKLTHPKLIWSGTPPPPLKSVKPTVKVSVGVPQQLFPVNVQTVYVVPSITHVTLDPLHCVLLGQHTLGCCTRFNCSCHLIIFVVIIGWGGGGGAGWRGGRWGRGWWWWGWRGEGRPLGNRVFPGSSSPLAGRERKTNKTECDIIYDIKLYHLLQKCQKTLHMSLNLHAVEFNAGLWLTTRF